MGLKSLIQLATTIAFLVASSGKVPEALQLVRVAQLNWLKDSQATKWGQAQLLSGD